MPLLSVTQTAEALSISRQRVLQLIQQRRIQAEKVGGVWIITEAEVERVKLMPRLQTGRPRKPKP